MPMQDPRYKNAKLPPCILDLASWIGIANMSRLFGMAVSSRGLGRVVLSHQTGVRIPVPLLKLKMQDAGFKMQGVNHDLA
jgi:hypothetical protein